MTTRTTEHGTFTITRTYPVPPERVFAAWSSQESKARWFGAPGASGYELDFRVGGTEINRGGPPGGPVYTYEATYRDIVPAERIVYGYVMRADDTLISVSVTTVEFAPAPSGTTLTFTEQGVFLDGSDTPAIREKGTGELLDALGAALGVSAGIVLIHRAMSLDGFIAGPDHQMDWIFDYAAPEAGAGVMATTGAMLSGRHTYEVGRRGAAPETSAAYGGAWSGAQFVLTHRAKTAEDDDAVIFLSGDVGDAVAAGLAGAGGKNLEVLGTDVTVQCLARGLVDEIYVHVLPVLLGAGVPLFRTPAMTAVQLEPMISSTNGSVSSMRFRVSKEP